MERVGRSRSRCGLGLQQQPPPACWPPWLPDSVELVVGCWGPILIPLAWMTPKTQRQKKKLAIFSKYRKQASQLSINLRRLLAPPPPHVTDECSSVCFTDQFNLNLPFHVTVTCYESHNASCRQLKWLHFPSLSSSTDDGRWSGDTELNLYCSKSKGATTLWFQTHQPWPRKSPYEWCCHRHQKASFYRTIA